ncbi:hypothetical protein BS636_03945 [Acinetobacter sp. LoGeW2-3]|nr:hypothetical protein BS636_03945 [Acinetobacter sp. LoGeW2-3]
MIKVSQIRSDYRLDLNVILQISGSAVIIPGDKLIKTIVDFIDLVFIIMPFSTYPCGIKHDD